MVIVWMCMEFFVKGDGDGEEEKEAEIKTTTNIKRRYDAKMLRGWYAIEVLVFMSNIISNIIFILARSWSRIRILNTRTNAIVNPNTDMIEEQ